MRLQHVGPRSLLRLALVLAALGLVSCAGSTQSAQRPAASPPRVAALRREPVGTDYLLVPPSADTGRSPRLQVGGTAYGVVVAVPPGYAALPRGDGRPGRWVVFLCHPTTAKQNLLSHAARVATLPAGQGDVMLVGVTGPYAVFSARASGQTLLEAVTLTGRRAGAIGRLGSMSGAFGSALVVRGFVIYRSPDGSVTGTSPSCRQETAR